MQSSEIRAFDTPENLKKFLEEEISKLRSLLGDYLRRLEEIRLKADRMKKAHDALSKIAGEKQMPSFEGREVDLTGMKVLVNPSPKQETEVVEDLVKALQGKLDALQKIRKAIDPLTTFEGGIVTISAVLVDNVPIRLMVYLKP
ncbi:MAG: hypothetical protein HXX80_06330 [Nitrososphaerales archaeon]|nr:hypothetical protein [Nitrososphaerales archaeon]